MSSRSRLSSHCRQKPSTRLYSNPSSPASRENSFMVSSVFSPPPSRYFQTARPGLIQSVSKPFGNSRGSGGGAFPRLDVRDLLADVGAFVMALEVVIPDGGLGGEHERRRLIRHSAALSGNDPAEADPAVEDAHLQRVGGAARRVPEGDARALEAVDRLSMHAAPGKALVPLVRFYLAHRGTLREVDAVHEKAEGRRLDHGRPPEGDSEAQLGLVALEQKLNGAVRTRDPNPVVTVRRAPCPLDIGRERGSDGGDGGGERRGEKLPALHQ